MKTKIILTIAFACGVLGMLRAQEEGPWSLEACIDYAQ